MAACLKPCPELKVLQVVGSGTPVSFASKLKHAPCIAIQLQFGGLVQAGEAALHATIPVCQPAKQVSRTFLGGGFMRLFATVSLIVIPALSALATPCNTQHPTPENPTIVLGLVGGFLMMWRYARTRLEK